MKKLPKVLYITTIEVQSIVSSCLCIATKNTMQNVTKNCYYCTYMHKKIIQKSNAGLT